MTPETISVSYIIIAMQHLVENITVVTDTQMIVEELLYMFSVQSVLYQRKAES
jgi:hypothetical protein